MTEALHREDLLVDAGLQRLAWELELLGLLEEVADRAREWFGAGRLLLDRSAGADSVEVRLVIGDDTLVDLWTLDPLLWDDANWAAMRYVPAGQVLVVRPRR